MKIKRSSWHYKWAYCISEEPNFATKYRYFWRLVYMTPVNILFLLIYYVLGLIIYTSLISCAAWLYKRKDGSEQFEVRTIDWWPRIKGITLRPIHFIVAIFIWYGFPWLIEFFTTLSKRLAISAIILSVGVLAYVIFRTLQLFIKSETIEFVDDK